MEFAELVHPLIEGKNLLEDAATELMRRTMAEELSQAQVGSFLSLMRAKGATAPELACFARVLRSHAVKIDNAYETLVDTCGTGGGIPSFNLSTAAMFVAAGAGIRIAKHGNRGVTSKCGSADVLEALGVKLIDSPRTIQHCLSECGVAFMLAPSFHPAMRVVGPIRRELGFRTVFNQLGPLLNPAGATGQVVGVYDQALVVPMANALGMLGTVRAVVVHAAEGLDEVSPCGKTYYAIARRSTVAAGEFHPWKFGMDPVELSTLNPGSDAADNARILREAISDINSPRAAAIVPNAACAIWAARVSEDFKECADIARQAIASGAALAKLESLIEVSNS